MKKVILFVSTSVLVALASCASKKDWTCTCTDSSSGASVTTNYTILQRTEDDTKTLCNPKTQSGNSSGTCIYKAK